MEKEFEALEFIKEKFAYLEYNCENFNVPRKELNTLHNALTELKSIKEAEPSEAMECLETESSKHCFWLKNYNTIKQALLKAQEMEKENAELKEVLEIIKDKNVDIWLVNSCFIVEQYNFSIIKISNSNVFTLFTLTQEEFDLLKRWNNGK